MTITSATPFAEFLAVHGTWTLTIRRDQQHLLATVRTGEELIEAMRALPRGGPYAVALSVGKAPQGSAEIIKLITHKLKEWKATRACIGIAGFYNDAMRVQAESEASHESL